MMHHIVVVDYPAPAAAFAALLDQRPGWQASALAPDAAHHAPPGALLLIEERLPDELSGLRCAQRMLNQRPDLVPGPANRQPAPLALWAATEWKLPGFLDKTIPLDDLLHQLDRACASRTAWSGDLLCQARAWNDDVAVHLKGLTSGHWMLWRDMVRGAGCARIAATHGWSPRTAERRQGELYTALGLESRAEAVSRAWAWGLVDERPDGLAWSGLAEEFLISQISAEAVNN